VIATPTRRAPAISGFSPWPDSCSNRPGISAKLGKPTTTQQPAIFANARAQQKRDGAYAINAS
jgi:hypothetical protein